MIKVGYVMLAINMIIAGAFWLDHGEDWQWHTRLFMIGAMLWIIGILIWYKVPEQKEDINDK